jgi:uncharacterized protein (DUF305 family)
MKIRTTLIAAAFLALPAIAQQHAHDGKAGAAGSGASQTMMESMTKGMDDMHSMKTTGNVDRDFATMMRKHHQHGIEMAEHEVKNGKDERMKSMARKILESQKKELREFDDWLASAK